MNKTKIDWADSTWNPVTGCLHGCEYCYAQRIALRFGEKDCGYTSYPLDSEAHIVSVDMPIRGKGSRILPYPYGFNPTFHRYRLDEPAKIKQPQTIFVCSMADLFGDWVPDSWIQAVFETCEAAPQHRYLFLTKNSRRYESLLDRHFPSNFWFGWSQTKPMGKGCLFTTHHSAQTFVSLEPLHEEFKEFDIRGIGWVIIGAETGNRKGKIFPKFDWIMDIKRACVSAGVPVFMKESLRCLMGDEFVQEFPWREGVKA